MLKKLRLLASFVFCTTVAALQSQLNPVRADHVCDDIQTHCNNYCQNPEAVENCEFFCPCYWGCKCGGGSNCAEVCGAS